MQDFLIRTLITFTVLVLSVSAGKRDTEKQSVGSGQAVIMVSPVAGVSTAETSATTPHSARRNKRVILKKETIVLSSQNQKILLYLNWVLISICLKILIPVIII